MREPKFLTEAVARLVQRRHPHSSIRVADKPDNVLRIEVSDFGGIEVQLRPPRKCCHDHYKEDLADLTIQLHTTPVKTGFIDRQEKDYS